MNTPILFTVFNRPNTTQKVFNEIRKIEPRQLFVVADGPRENVPTDQINCQLVRDIVSQITWDCDVKFLFRDSNLGCGRGMFEAISWFFEYVDDGIILEDDVLPSKSFFYFCQNLIARYRDDNRIAMISGTNHLRSKIDNNSYIFSKNKACWGWATWKRAWLNMDYNMNWRKNSNKNVMFNMGSSIYHQFHWEKALKLIDNDDVNAWDWQWYFSIAAQNQLTIFPCVNLTANIGFDSNGTHTKGNAKQEYLIFEDISFPLKHPNLICPNYEFDLKFEKYNMSPKFGIYSIIYRKLKFMLKNIY